MTATCALTSHNKDRANHSAPLFRNECPDVLTHKVEALRSQSRCRSKCHVLFARPLNHQSVEPVEAPPTAANVAHHRYSAFECPVELFGTTEKSESDSSQP